MLFLLREEHGLHHVREEVLGYVEAASPEEAATKVGGTIRCVSSGNPPTYYLAEGRYTLQEVWKFTGSIADRP